MLWGLAEKYGVHAIAGIPAAQDTYWYDHQGRLHRETHFREFIPWRQTLVFKAACKLVKLMDNWDDFMNECEDWFTAVEWHFRTRIEEEE